MLGLLAQFLSQERDIRAQAELQPCPLFRSGSNCTKLQAGLPPLIETRSKSCPFAPRELLRFSATMGRSDSRRVCITGYAFPACIRTRATCRPVRPAGSPRFPGAPLSTCRLQTPRATRHEAPVVLPCRWQASPFTWRVAAATRVTRPNRVQICYGRHSI